MHWRLALAAGKLPDSYTVERQSDGGGVFAGTRQSFLQHTTSTYAAHPMVRFPRYPRGDVGFHLLDTALTATAFAAFSKNFHHLVISRGTNSPKNLCVFTGD